MALTLDAFGWPVDTIRSLDDLRRVVEPRLRCFGKARCLFRGQADATWDLRPTIARFIGDSRWSANEAIEAEKRAIELFVPAARPHLGELERQPEGLVEWWSVMQHYGVPTRALDWSDDPYVAMYFSVVSHGERDGALWFVHADSVQQQIRRRYGTKKAPSPPGPEYYCLPAAPEQLFFGDVLLGTRRKDAQRGMFSWCRRVSSDHAAVVAAALHRLPAPHNLFRRLIIPADLKPVLREALAGVGINEDYVLPDPQSGLANVAAAVSPEIVRSASVS